MKLTRCSALVVASLALGGCADLQQMIGSPFPSKSSREGADEYSSDANQSDNRTGLTVDERAKLIRLRCDIPARPVPPSGPKIAQVPPASVINKPAVFRGTTAPILRPSEETTPRIAVIGGESLVGADSSAGQFVADMLFAALQERQASLVDRDYRVARVNELGDFSQGVVERSSSSDAKWLSAAQPVDYFVIVHRLTVPGEVIQVSIPWQASDAEWTKYLARKETYLSAVTAYNQAVQAYNDFCLVLVRAKSPQERLNAGLDHNAAEIERLEALQESVERTPEVRVAVEREKTPSRDHDDRDGFNIPPQLLWNGGVENMGRIQAQQAALILAAQQAGGRRPQPVELDSASLFETREEAVPKQGEPLQVAAYQCGLSVRVIKADQAVAVWFGVASAQNTTFSEAMFESCEKIAAHLIGPAPEMASNAAPSDKK